ncbi:hypothetical protein BT93_H2644 [Corymbia citriodora subsp. variegata]|nr:hypothetical protein BT93_H2644 [Corymbia citriodora subsp. variegata]
MQCADHPFRGNLGGICAFCLQEKLGKLVSSSSPLPLPRPSSSSSASSSPPFRSGAAPRGYAAAAFAPAASSVSVNPAIPLPSNRQDGSGGGGDVYHARRAARIVPFLLAKNKSRKKKKVAAGATTAAEMISFKRSKSTTTQRRGGGRFLDEEAGNDDFSPRRRGGFWSFLYLSSYSAASGSGSGGAVARRDSKSHSRSRSQSQSQFTSNAMNGPVVEDGNCDNAGSTSASAATSSFERKVSRSRSVGCGSRSFSGDFFERISTGFGDCTLRRVESQREASGRGQQKPRISAAHGGERVRCGGIFGGFAAMASSSSSSSSSSHWVSAGCSADQEMAHNSSSSSRSSAAAAAVHGGGSRGHRSWGWAFASPLRAFGRPAHTKDGKREKSVVAGRNRNNATTSPNLAAIPSLLAVRG